MVQLAVPDMIEQILKLSPGVLGCLAGVPQHSCGSKTTDSWACSGKEMSISTGTTVQSVICSDHFLCSGRCSAMDDASAILGWALSGQFHHCGHPLRSTKRS